MAVSLKTRVVFTVVMLCRSEIARRFGRKKIDSIFMIEELSKEETRSISTSAGSLLLD
jgi:hypothetical protein